MIRQSGIACLASQVAALLFAVCAFVPGVATAQTTTTQTQAQPDRWTFDAYIYGYLPDMSGSVTFPTGTTANITVDASNIVNHLKFTVMGWLEAHRGQVDLFTDILYVDLGGSKSATRDISIGNGSLPAGVTADANMDAKSTLWTLAAGYRFVDTPQWAFELFGGARMLELKQKLGWQFSADVGPFTGPGRQGSSEVDANNWDAIVGARARLVFGERGEWFVPVYVDVGTGQSQLTWQTFGGVGYKFNWGDVVALWRYIDYRFSNGDNSSLKLNGPAVGVGFHW